MTVREVFEKSLSYLKEKHIPQSRLDVELLLAFGLGLKDRVAVYLEFDRPLEKEEVDVLRGLIVRRAQLEPVAYILGYKDFYKDRFLVTPMVLVPRPETELMVEEAVRFVQEQNLTQVKFADLGSGSGCVGLSFYRDLRETVRVQGQFYDVSREALNVSKKNAGQLFGNSNDLQFLEQDLNIYVPHETYNVILANPPYIDFSDSDMDPGVKKYEPALALFAEDQGLFAIKKWIQNWIANLESPGIFILEIGSRQSQAVLEFIRNQQYQKFTVRVLQDLSQRDRFIVLTKSFQV